MKPAIRFLLVALLCTALPTGFSANQAKDDRAEVALQAAIKTETIDGNLKGAIAQYQKIAQSPNRVVAAQALVHLGQCYEKLGEAQLKDARAIYERIVRDFGDQAEATKMARARLSALIAVGSGSRARAEVVMRRAYKGDPEEVPVSISPDGRSVVFTRLDSGGYWLRDLQSGERRRFPIQEPGTPDGQALISPDGKRLLTQWEVKGGFLETRVSALDGTADQMISREPVMGRAIVPTAWMPDSRRFLATVMDVANKVALRVIVSVPDGGIRDVGHSTLGMWLDWGHPSPDGRFIAYSLYDDRRNKTNQIFVYDIETERDVAVVQSPANNTPVGWTPDGSSLVFMSDRSGTQDLYLQGIAGGGPRGEPQLLKRDFPSSNLRLARDGRLYRFERTDADESFSVPVDKQSVKLTGAPSPVNHDSYPKVLSPRWSADGKLLYYQAFKGGTADQTAKLFIRSEDSGQTRMIAPTTPMAYWTNPILSPDGRRFLVTATEGESNRGLFAIDSETGAVSLLVSIPLGETNSVNPEPNWSPDGKAVFYKLPAPEKGGGFIVRCKDLVSGEVTDVFKGFHTREMKISPDGTRMVYVRSMGTSQVLGVLDLQSLAQLELWRVTVADPQTGGTSGGVGALPIKAPIWTPDGRHVLVARDLKPGTELWRFPATGGPGEKLHVFPVSTSAFVMHPSGTGMAFTQHRTSYELWVLENFLPVTQPAVKK